MAYSSRLSVVALANLVRSGVLWENVRVLRFGSARAFEHAKESAVAT
jgi:hypothetical protein